MSDMAICTKCAALSRELSQATDYVWALADHADPTPDGQRELKLAKAKALRAERRYTKHIVEKHQLTIPF